MRKQGSSNAKATPARRGGDHAHDALGGMNGVAGLMGNDFMRQMADAQAPDVERAEDHASGSAGEALPADVRERAELAFGEDLGDVRVHHDREADHAAGAARAEAYAKDRDIFFKEGAYDPSSKGGRELLAHELTHVVQPGGGGPAAGVSEPGSAGEKEAEALSDVLDTNGADEPEADGDHVSVGNMLMRSPDDDPPELTDAQINDEIANAQTIGNSTPPPVIQANDPGEETFEGETPEAGETKDAGEVTATAGELFAAVGGPASLPQTFQELTGGDLGGWDDEIAWHDHFVGGEGGLGGVELDRGALVKDALLGGLGEGLVQGTTNFAIGTAMSVGASKIPHLAGFVEMAKIAYDPEAWFQGVSQNTFGKAAEGVDQLWNGDPITKLEGLLNLLDGLNGVVSTLSTICYIVAAAGFLLSFICPACLPFVVLCAQWGKMLGTISALVGIFITLGRGVLASLRALQILYGDADPETTLAQTESLRHQTTQFTTDFTSNTMGSLRDRATGALDQRRRTEHTGAPPRQNQATADPPSRLSLALGLATGNWGTQGSLGSGLSSAYNDVGTQRDTTRATTDAFSGRGDYETQAPRTTGQRLLDMEDAGAQVFGGKRHKARVTSMLEEDGQGANAHSTPHARLLAEQQAVDTRRLEAAAESDRAESARQRAQGEVEAARSALEASQQQLDRLRRENGEVLPALRQEADDYQALRESYGSDLDAARQQLQASRSAEDAARAQVEANPSDPSAHQAHRDATENTRAASERFDQARSDVSEADRMVRQSREQIREREARAAGAERSVASDQQRLDAGTAAAPGAEQTAAHAHAASTREDQAYNDWNDSDSGGKALARREEPASDYQTPWWLALNKGGKLGGLTKTIGERTAGAKTTDVLNGAPGLMNLGAPQPEAAADPTLGIWRSTLDDKAIDFNGNHSGRGAGKDYPSMAQQRLDAAREQLAAMPPPREAPNKVDGAIEGLREVDEEERQIQFQRGVMDGLLEEGAGELDALQVLDRIREANQQAIAAHEAELEARNENQSKLQDKSTETVSESEKGAQKGGEGASRLGDFVSGFARLMGIVPRRLVSGGGGGAAGLGAAMTDQTETSSQASSDAATTRDAAVTMKADTQVAQQDVVAIDGEHDAMGGQISEQELEAIEGVAFIEQTKADSEARMAALGGERARLQADHDTAVSGMVGWVTDHGATRRAALGDLDGVVSLAQAETGG